jgi:chemotaxis protein CheX
MQAELINPFILSVGNVFQTMLGCSVERKSLYLKDHHSPTYEVSAVIGLSGKASGAVVLSLSRSVALKVVETLLNVQVGEINADVLDAVGELTNMVAGGAKARLSQYEMSLGLPSMITGRNHSIKFPSNIHPICVGFETRWGPLSLEVGLDLPD